MKKALSWIFGARQYSYIFPHMSEGMSSLHMYDEVIDLGGHSVLPLLTTNIKAKKYTLYTNNMFIKNLYSILRTVKIDYEKFLYVASTINVYDNRLAISFAYEMDIRYNRVNKECEKENLLYYGILYEYVSRMSYHLFPKAYSLQYKEMKCRERGFKISKMYRNLNQSTISLLWNEISTLKELISNSGRIIDVVYMPPKRMYDKMIDEKINEKNICFYSLFPSCVTTDTLELSLPSEDKRMLHRRDERLEKLYALCVKKRIPFVASTVYRVGLSIYEDLDEFIFKNKIRYKMYRASHNKSDIIVFGNKL